MSTDPAVTAAEQAVRTRVFASAAEAAVAAARPIIEAEVRAQPDRPRAQPDERIVYLPVRVTFEGLADPTNGPYFKGLVQMSSAYPETTYSISESQVLTREQVEAEVRERIAAEVRAWCHEERHGQAVEGDHWITVLCGDCEELAARIARGQA